MFKWSNCDRKSKTEKPEWLENPSSFFIDRIVTWSQLLNAKKEMKNFKFSGLYLG